MSEKSEQSEQPALLADDAPSGVGVCGVPCVLNPEQYACILPAGHDGKHVDGVHRWDTPAPLADAPDDVEALAAALSAMDDMEQVGTYEGHARAILASDYLAARDADLTARAEAAVAERIAKAIEGTTEGLVAEYGVAWNIAVADAAAIARAAASYTRDGADDGEADHG